MNISDKVFSILRKVVPDLTFDSFIQKLAPSFDSELSPIENKAKMLEAIKQGLFGETLAKAADNVLQNKPSTEESMQVIQNYESQQGKTISHVQPQGNEKESLKSAEIGQA